MKWFHAPPSQPKTVHGARSRRAFLKLMAQSGAAVGLTRLLWPSVSEAADPSPLRFVALWTAHGKLEEYWTPQGGETDFNIDFQDATLQPLQPYRDQLLILDGLDYRVLYEYGSSGHDGGPVTFLTGSPVSTVAGEAFPTSQSLDQFLGDQVGTATRFRSLQLMSYSAFGGQGTGDSLSFQGSGTRVPWERDPAAVYDRVFGSLMVGAPTAAETRALNRRKSLLDYLTKDATRLRSRLAGTERAKLDAHLSALSDIEKRLQSTSGTACTKPTAPAAQTDDQLDDENNAPANTKLMLDMAAQAMACELTRFITLPMLVIPSAPWIGLTENLHDDLAHRVNDSDPTARAMIRSRLNMFHRYNAGLVAYFLAALKAVSEGGGTMLDHSIVLWGNELGDPDNHTSYGIPTVLAGGANGKFRMGRYLQLRPGMDALTGWNNVGDKAPDAIAHNHLLVSIAQAFDQNIQTFGKADYVGPLPGLV
jgi:hypothetical protein